MLNSCSLHELSEIRRLIDAGSCLIILGGWLDLILMYCAWIKKNNSSFDVTMGSYDGAEVCELVGLFILNGLCNEYGKESIGLYRDDGLAIFRNISGPQTERIRKNITRHFKKHGLKITIQTNLKIVNYLDVTFNLSNGSYYPYRKPSNLPLALPFYIYIYIYIYQLGADERTTNMSSLHFLHVNSKLGRQHTRRRWQPLSVHL